jgi:hypothetical protein
MIFGDGRGLRTVTGDYGTVQTTGGGVNGWEGYSIDGRYVFMSADDNNVGIYNDVDNEWMIYCARNAWTKLYYDGAEKLSTTSTGVTVTGTGSGPIIDFYLTGSWSAGVYYRIMGYNTGKQIQFSYNDGMWISDNNSIRFACGGSTGTGGVYTERMRITNAGYVGIGQTSPSYKLHITDGDNSVALFGPNSTWSSYLVVGSGTNKSPSFNTSYAQVLTTNGNLHLDAGYTRDIYLNYYNGSRVLFGPGVAVVHSSDDRLKTQEELIENATQTLMKLKPQKYLKIHRLPEDNDVREPVPEAGLIAQDVWYDAPELRFIVKPGNDANPSEEKPPEPVTGDIQQDPDYSDWGTTPAGLSYICLIPYLIKSNQELYTEIQTLKTRITALENA